MSLRNSVTLTFSYYQVSTLKASRCIGGIILLVVGLPLFLYLHVPFSIKLASVEEETGIQESGVLLGYEFNILLSSRCRAFGACGLNAE